MTDIQCSVEGCTNPVKVKSRGWCSAHYQRWWAHGDPLAGRTPEGAGIAWLEQHIGHVGDDCLIWPFARGNDGYGRIMAQTSSRIMCRLVHGEPPSPKHESAHSCGKGHLGCVHPQHLRWATRIENLADKIKHGTICRGEQHGGAKLTRDNVLEIRDYLGPHKDIAERLGISKVTVSNIKHRVSWAWLEGGPT